MFESLGFQALTPVQASAILGLLIGLAYGALAERSRFCLRRGLVGPAGERRAALGVWALALAVALIGTQAAVGAGLISFSDHRFLAADLPLAAVLGGGLLFGAGMVLSRGCASRLTVLAGTGNLRAATVILVFAVIAHATLKGVLAPLRVVLGGLTVPLGDNTSLAALPGGALPWTGFLAFALLVVALRSGARPGTLAMGAAIGLLVPLAWVGTGFLLYDDFDPIALESLSFTAPSADALFWTIAATSIPAGFGTGLIGGVLLGALGASLTARSFRWQSFASPRDTGRYLAGAALMGVGGVLAGGCTIGAGLAGVPTLGLSALLALAAIAAGAKATDRLLSASPSGSAAAQAT
ncbi:YeeE/YedE family protein [Acidimangrovimonas pyrenivorans]|uniref:YeeE/YedE family protein n=1 Tax=Acidimangrovimonas pyrenivorans TaxID=2030798 RepID=A0ABV7AFN8_9RHOB